MRHAALSPAGALALASLQHLAHRREQGNLSREDFIAQTLPLVARGLGCDRVSLWLLSPDDRELVLRCEAVHDATGAPASRLAPLRESAHAAYFDELDRAGILHAPDALQHPALASMRESYLLPGDVRSLLDVPFAVNGRRLGLLCAIQTGRRLDWQPADIALMRRAGIVASLLSWRLQQGESDPSRY